MTEYIAQTADRRNISYIDDDPASVKRRAEFAGYEVVKVITIEQYQAKLHTAAEELSA